MKEQDIFISKIKENFFYALQFSIDHSKTYYINFSKNIFKHLMRLSGKLLIYSVSSTIISLACLIDILFISESKQIYRDYLIYTSAPYYLLKLIEIAVTFKDS